MCIIYKKNKTKTVNTILELQDKLYDDYKVTLVPIYITETDFKKRAKKNLSLVNNIVKDGILITGKLIRELIKWEVFILVTSELHCTV